MTFQGPFAGVVEVELLATVGVSEGEALAVAVVFADALAEFPALLPVHARTGAHAKSAITLANTD